MITKVSGTGWIIICTVCAQTLMDEWDEAQVAPTPADAVHDASACGWTVVGDRLFCICDDADERHHDARAGRTIWPADPMPGQMEVVGAHHA